MENKVPKRYLVTSALPYANGPLHIGHLAGAYIPADIYVRYLRKRDRDVLWICGSDEHGVPITIRARQEGITPQEVVDKYHVLIKDSFSRFGISFDIYSRTSSAMHYETASAFFKHLHSKGIFIEQESEQYYDASAEQFLADRYIVGTCPHCMNDKAYGDQCESCGTSLNPQDLINPRSMLSGSKPELRSTKHWYLPLDRYQPQIEEWILSKSDWKVNVYGQCKSWLNQGLQPRAVSRDLPWGVPVPLPHAEGKVLYVWFDAPIGYISATRELTPRWEEYWKSEDTKLVHFIGKDNIVFHCIVFPTMLLAHGEYILPANVPANEFLNLEGEKISTSRNWAVWLHEYLDEGVASPDALRYTLTANMPESKDNDFTWREFQARNNNELVAVLGNYFHRVVVLTHKFYDGRVPDVGSLYEEFCGDGPAASDVAALSQIEATFAQVAEHVEGFRFRDALRSYMDLARTGNQYLAAQEPWKLHKHDAVRCEQVMYTALQISAALAWLADIFLPFTAKRMQSILRMDALRALGWEDFSSIHILPSGHTIDTPHLLFEQVEDSTVEAQLARLRSMREAAMDAPSVAAAKPAVEFSQFDSLDLRVGTVLEAVPVPKTHKLLKLKVSTGLDERTIVSGIAEHFSPEELVGRRVCVVLNLAPRKIRGIESEGMLIFAQTPDGALRLLSPEGEAPDGSTIG